MKMKNHSQTNPILEIGTQQIPPGSVLKSLYKTGEVIVTFCVHTPGEVRYHVWLEHGAMGSWRTGMMFAPSCKQGWTSVFPQALCLDLPVTFLFHTFWKPGQDGYKDHSFRMHLFLALGRCMQSCFKTALLWNYLAHLSFALSVAQVACVSNKKTYLISAGCFDIWVKGAGKNAGFMREDISKACVRAGELILLCAL